MDVQEHEVRLGFRSQPLMRIAGERQLPQIKAAFSQVLGRSIQVHLEVSGKSTAQASVSRQPQRQQATAQVDSQTATQTPVQITAQRAPVPEISQNLPKFCQPTRTTCPTINSRQWSRQCTGKPNGSIPKTTDNTT